VERAVWTDERLDDLARRMDTGFERLDQDIRELRQEVHGGFGSLNRLLLQVGGGLIAAMLVGFLSLLAAILTTA
jgi:hypothetical protein